MEERKEECYLIAERINKHFAQYQSRPALLCLKVKLDRFSYWPYKLVKLTINNNDCFLWPVTRWTQPAIIVPCQSRDLEDRNKAKELALRILNAISWNQNYGLQNEDNPFVQNSVSPPFQYAASLEPIIIPISDTMISQKLLLDENDELSFPTDRKAQKALALYRETLNQDNIFYKFLGFARILNLKCNDGGVQWINDNVKDIQFFRNIEAYNAFKKLDQELKKYNKHSTLGEYLYKSGRCAIAHTNNEISVNPDNPEDEKRIRNEVPIMKEIARQFMEKEYKIKTPETIYREHNYELKGFGELLGWSTLEKLRKNVDVVRLDEEISQVFINEISDISIRLRDQTDDVNDNLIIHEAKRIDGVIFITCLSVDGYIEVTLCLDFIAGRIECPDLPNCFSVKIDNSEKSKELFEKQKAFVIKLIRNGILEIWSGDKLLGRKDPYLPDIRFEREVIPHMQKLSYDHLMNAKPIETTTL
jgi:hypothetical protein